MGRQIVFHIPHRIATPISWSSKPGLFGQKYWIKWTDGSYRRCSHDTILKYAGRLIMDEDLKLADRLARHAVGAVNELEDDLFAAHEAITRLHATITQMTNAIDGLEFQLNEARAEIERLKSDVSDLVRAGSDEATENERLVKERDDWKERALDRGVVGANWMDRAIAAEAQRDAAREALRPFAVWAQKMPAGAAPRFGYEIASILAQAAVCRHLTGEHFRAASRTLEGE